MASMGGNNQALTGVTVVHDNDIICGRGGLALKHPGNMAYRKIVGLNKELYATCLKTEKLRISKSIVAAIREIKGRFLEREDGKTSAALDEKDENGNPVKWRDIGDKRAIEKTSQALREGQPKLLKKLAQQQDNGVMTGGGVNGMGMNGLYNQINQMGVAPQPQMMSQFGNMHQQQVQVQGVQGQFDQFQGGVQVQTFGHQPQPPLQNTIQNNVQDAFVAERRASLIAQQRASFTLASLMEGQSINTFPRNSFNDGLEQANQLRAMSAGSYRGHDSWHDSWGSENPAPLPSDERMYERSNSTRSQDSWGGEDPMPLPYQEGGETENGHVFSTDDHNQLMSVLGVEGGDASQKAPPEIAARPGNKRPSVKFKLQPQRDLTSVAGMSSAMSLCSHLSELSIFSDALSLDSAMDAQQREAEFEMLGEFEAGDMSLGTFESSGSGEGDTPKPRRSILRKRNKWTTQAAAFPQAALSHHPDPGLIFTSTLDTKPGGVNCGTDVSGLITERRKSVVAFEIDVNRRRSSRMSMCSALTDFSERYKRDLGSTLSIQSADFRDLLADIEDEDNSSIEEGNSP